MVGKILRIPIEADGPYTRTVSPEFTDVTPQLFPTRVGGFTLTGVTSLGEDASGEIYITTLGGDVFKIRGGRR
jgi:hypothetical protein